jgi:predicted alpha/beta-fold hydrolase
MWMLLGTVLISTSSTGMAFACTLEEQDSNVDSALQCPTWGYPTEGAYYRDATSTDSMLAIRIPFLSIQAEDDPVSYGFCVSYGNDTDRIRLLAGRLCHIRK